MARKPKLAQPKSASRSGPVTAVQVHPAAWELALILAGGDSSRLRITGASEVIVENRGRS